MAYLFAKVIVIFDLKQDPNPNKIRDESNFWSLMWLALALGVGTCQFLMGAISTHVSHVRGIPVE